MEEEENEEKKIFVTVGTTLFDPLVEAVTCRECLLVLARLGYTHITIQYGKGRCPPGFPSDGTVTTVTDVDDKTDKKPTQIKVETYDFKPTLQEDIKQSTLMISHAGAGSIMEGLELSPQRKLLVVVNPALMNNHQSELGEALSKRGYLWHLQESKLLSNNSYSILKLIDHTPLSDVPKWPKGDSWAFPKFLDSFMGFADQTKEKSNDGNTPSLRDNGTQQQAKQSKTD